MNKVVLLLALVLGTQVVSATNLNHCDVVLTSGFQPNLSTI